MRGTFAAVSGFGSGFASTFIPGELLRIAIIASADGFTALAPAGGGIDPRAAGFGAEDVVTVAAGGFDMAGFWKSARSFAHAAH